MDFLARFPDSHIVRKHGMEVAEKVRRSAEEHRLRLQASDNPKICLGELIRFDQTLKNEGINPGTSADLTVATLLAETFGFA